MAYDPVTGQVRITADDRGPSINIVNWITLVIMCLSSLTKALTKSWSWSWREWSVTEIPGDTVLILGAMLCGIGQSLAMSMQVANGLGRRGESLTDEELVGFQKTGYAAQHFYLLALSLAKFATLYFLWTLARTSNARYIVIFTVALAAIWTLTGQLSITFQCALPTPWLILSRDKCINQAALLTSISVLDIVIDMLLIAIPINFLWSLQLPWSKKSSVMFAFAVRALSVPVTALRIYYIAKYASTPDQPFDGYSLAVTTLISMNLSIVLACLPFLKTFMDHMQHGVFTSDLRTAPGHNTKTASYALGSIGKTSRNGSRLGGSGLRGGSKLSGGGSKGGGTPLSSGLWGGSKSTGAALPVGDGSPCHGHIHGTITTAVHPVAEGKEDGESIKSSNGGSDRMIIKQTREFTVESESVGGDDQETDYTRRQNADFAVAMGHQHMSGLGKFREREGV